MIQRYGLVQYHTEDGRAWGDLVTSDTGEYITFKDYEAEKSAMSSNAVLGDGWRDCAKDLPDDRRDVIIGNANNKCVSVGWWNSEHNNGEGKWLIRTVHFDGEVTHWMELPDPPVFA